MNWKTQAARPTSPRSIRQHCSVPRLCDRSLEAHRWSVGWGGAGVSGVHATTFCWCEVPGTVAGPCGRSWWGSPSFLRVVLLVCFRQACQVSVLQSLNKCFMRVSSGLHSHDQEVPCPCPWTAGTEGRRRHRAVRDLCRRLEQLCGGW